MDLVLVCVQCILVKKLNQLHYQPLQRSTAILGFESLKGSVYSLLATHPVPYLISLVSGEHPQGTSTMFQEAQSAAQVIIDSVLNVHNLKPLAFLNSTGKVVTVDDLTSLPDIPMDITYIHLRCSLDGTALDARVDHAKPIHFNFCLRLPQYLFDVSAGTATLVSSTTVTNPLPRTTKLSLASLFLEMSTPPSSPETSSTILYM